MIWLAGCNGMLGRDISLQLKASKLNFLETDIDVNLTSMEDINHFISNKKIDWIINCSAYTAVDQAEDDAEIAYQVNGDSVSNLVQVAKVIGAKIVHFSTDYVFDGKKRTAYVEEDETSPSGVYGASKLAGENALVKFYDKYFIFRVSWLYGFYGKNFVHTMLNLFKTKDSLTVVDDQFGSPAYTGEIASFIIQLIKNDSKNYGIYHFSGEGETTWHEFASEVYSLAKKYSLINRDVKIEPVDSSQYPTKVKRPEYSYMSKDKLFEVFKFRPQNWKVTLEEYISSIKGKK